MPALALRMERAAEVPSAKERARALHTEGRKDAEVAADMTPPTLALVLPVVLVLVVVISRCPCPSLALKQAQCARLGGRDPPRPSAVADGCPPPAQAQAQAQAQAEMPRCWRRAGAGGMAGLCAAGESESASIHSAE